RNPLLCRLGVGWESSISSWGYTTALSNWGWVRTAKAGRSLYPATRKSWINSCKKCAGKEPASESPNFVYRKEQEMAHKNVLVSLSYEEPDIPYTEIVLVVRADPETRQLVEADVESLFNSIQVHLRCKGYQLGVMEDVSADLL